MKSDWRLFLYDEPRSRSLKLGEVASYVKSLWPKLELHCRGDYILHHLSNVPQGRREKLVQELSKRWAKLRVGNPRGGDENREPLPLEIDYERRRITDPEFQAAGILYEGPGVLALLMGLLSAEEQRQQDIHVAFTNQLVGTWSEEDARYHARVSIYGPIHIISTLGVVVAPARPREYYFAWMTYQAVGLGVPADGPDEFMQGCLVPEDPRLTDILKGYVCQALFYSFTGEPFCDSPHCRLYNAHWQTEVLTAQLGGPPGFCAKHLAAISSLQG